MTSMQALRLAGDLADAGGERGVAVPAVDDRPAVDRDDVAFLQAVRPRGCRARSCRSATCRSTAGNAVVVEEVRPRAPAVEHVARDRGRARAVVTPGRIASRMHLVHLGDDPAGARASSPDLVAPTSRTDRRRRARRRQRSRRVRGMRPSMARMSRSVTSSAEPRPSTVTSSLARRVPRDERLGLLVVQVEALAHRLGRVVVALHDLAATHVARPVVSGRRLNRVVGAAVDAHPAVRDALEHDVLRHLEVDDEVERHVDGQARRAPRPGRPCAGSRRGCSPRLRVSSLSSRSPTTPMMMSSGSRSPRRMYSCGLAAEVGALLDARRAACRPSRCAGRRSGGPAARTACPCPPPVGPG